MTGITILTILILEKHCTYCCVSTSVKPFTDMLSKNTRDKQTPVRNWDYTVHSHKLIRCTESYVDVYLLVLTQNIKSTCEQ